MKTLILAALAVAAITPAAAQQPAPGWFPTGEWQCGPVRIVSSTDGFGAVNFQINGAWFDNNYTIRRGQLFYNGLACASLGDPWAFMKPPSRRRQTATEQPSDRRCNDALSPEDREKYCE